MLRIKACIIHSIPVSYFSLILFTQIRTPSFRVGSFEMELYSSACLELDLLFLWISLCEIQGILLDSLLPIQNFSVTSAHHLYLQRGEPGMMYW